MRFALQGLGTPAPIAPPQHLVVTGLYRYVRNPMYVAVVAVILGQAILFGDWRLMTYGGLMWLAFYAFVLTYEEPVLAQKFGAQYEDFRANVPRWIPRLYSMAHRIGPPAQWRRRGERGRQNSKAAAHYRRRFRSFGRGHALPRIDLYPVAVRAPSSNNRSSRLKPTICSWNFQGEF